MPDRIDLANVTGMKYQPSISSCWTGSGTIVIQSSDKILPEIRMRVGGAESVYAALREVRIQLECLHRPPVHTRDLLLLLRSFILGIAHDLCVLLCSS